jgi:hypothetical protein
MGKIKGIIDILQESSETVPAILYKYYEFDKYSQLIFENNEIFFSSPKSFNDPFDSKIKISFQGTRSQKKLFFRKHSPQTRPDFSRKKHLEMEKHIMRDEISIQKMESEIQNNFENVRKQMGVFCLTEKKDNILMWSHYTNEHTGFCVGFKTNNNFFSRAKHVSYSKDLPCIYILEPDLEKLNKKGAESLLTKAEDWTYEKEWRIVEINGVGVKNYPEEALVSVILGCKISSENKKNIIQWCNSRKYKPALYEAREKDSEFGLDIIPIS